MTRAAIEKDRVTAVILLFLIAAGMTAYQGLPRAEDPEITYRRAVVLTQLPGASTNRIEHLVTDTIEATLQEIPEIEYIASRSRTGVSLITVRVRDDVGDVQAVWDNLRRKVARVAPDLPDGTIGPVVNDEFGDIFGIIVTLTGDGYSYAELKQMADAVRDDLLRIDDVAKVHIYGAQDQRIFRRLRARAAGRGGPRAAPTPLDPRKRQRVDSGGRGSHRCGADRPAADWQLRVGR